MPVRRKGEHQMSCHNTINSEVLSDIKWVLKNPPKKLSSLVSNDFVNYLSLSLKDRRNNHPMVEEFIRQKIIPCDVHPMRGAASSCKLLSLQHHQSEVSIRALSIITQCIICFLLTTLEYLITVQHLLNVYNGKLNFIWLANKDNLMLLN